MATPAKSTRGEGIATSNPEEPTRYRGPHGSEAAGFPDAVERRPAKATGQIQARLHLTSSSNHTQTNAHTTYMLYFCLSPLLSHFETL